MNLILIILAIICLECKGNHLTDENDDLFINKPNLRHQHHSEIVRHRLQEAVQAFKFKPNHRTTTTIQPILENSHRLRHSNRLHQTWDRKYHSFENKSILTTTTTTTQPPPPRTVYRKSLLNRQHSSGHTTNQRNISTPHRQRHYKAQENHFIRIPVAQTTVPTHLKKIQNSYDILKIPYRDRLNVGKRFDKEIDEDQDDDDDNDDNYEDKDYRNDYFQQNDRFSIPKKTPSNMLKTYENHKNKNKNSRKRPSVELDDYYDDEEQGDVENDEDEDEDDENQRKDSKTNDDNYVSNVCF